MLVQPARIATDKESVDWLMYKDLEMHLRKGVRVCIMCLDHSSSQDTPKGQVLKYLTLGTKISNFRH